MTYTCSTPKHRAPWWLLKFGVINEEYTRVSSWRSSKLTLPLHDLTLVLPEEVKRSRMISPSAFYGTWFTASVRPKDGSHGSSCGILALLLGTVPRRQPLYHCRSWAVQSDLDTALLSSSRLLSPPPMGG